MMVPKRSVCVFLLGLLAAALPSPAAASSHATAKATFAPHSQVASPKLDEASRPKRDAALQHVVAARGGADSTANDAIGGVLGFFVIDTAVRKLFEAYDISFPSQLGGCLILFVAMVLGELVIPGVGDKVFSLLNPGSLLLAKWLPVFFVPGLAMLPLAVSMAGYVSRSELSLYRTFMISYGRASYITRSLYCISAVGRIPVRGTCLMSQ